MVVLSRNGKLVLWRFSDGEKPESKASRLDEVELGWPGGMLSPWNARSTTPFQWDAKAGQISFAYSDLRPARALIRTLTWKLDLENAKAELVSDKTIDPHEKRHLEHIPLRFGPFVMTKDEKRTAETQADGTIKLREMKANEAVTERVLRLDDE